MVNDEIVESILKERYYQIGETSWSDIAKRVANFVGDSDKEKEDFFNVISQKLFIPNSPALMNAGTKNPMLFACYALGADDSIDSIFETMKVAAKIMKLGGGIGVDWSHLRPEGTLVRSTNGTSSGVIAFMRNFNEVIETVKSGGRRRGAGISLLDIDHGDSSNFITCKNTEGVFPNFNISVKITDSFMNSLDNETAKFDAIAKAMWTRAEPGICFIDTAKRALVVPLEPDEDIGLNPCGEQVLVYNFKKTAGECCNLGSINMSDMYDPTKQTVNYRKLEGVVRIAVRYLDNSIDKSIYPTSNIEEMAKDTRKIGLGEMGWADLFLKMGIRYGSEASLILIQTVKEYIKNVAENESEKIAYEKGSFPKINKTALVSKRRNAAITTEAPTGSISLFAGCSSGIEPVFSYVVDRKNSCGTGKIIHKEFLRHVQWKYPSNVDVIVEWMHSHGSIQNCPHVDEMTKEVFVTAMDITPIEHIDVQAEFQKYTDASISKTLNLPENTTVDDIKKIIIYAWKRGLKGLTVYRHNSRNTVVYDIKKDAPVDFTIQEVDNPVKYKLVTANGRILPKTPRDMMGIMAKRTSGCGKLYISIGESSGVPHTVLIKNKGGCTAMTQTVAELTAALLRWRVPRWEITRILNGIKCEACAKNPNADGRSCADIIGSVIKQNYPDEEIPNKYEGETLPSKIKENKTIPCPECGEGVVFESGCVTCKHCGYSKCG